MQALQYVNSGKLE